MKKEASAMSGKKQIFGLIMILFFSFLIIGPILNTPEVRANSDLWERQEGKEELRITFDASTNPKDNDPRVIAVKIIKVFLTFLAIIMTAIILYGGFKWMTAGGNQDQVNEAKKLVINASIGMVVILSSYMITVFVSDCMLDILAGGTTWMCK